MAIGKMLKYLYRNVLTIRVARVLRRHSFIGNHVVVFSYNQVGKGCRISDNVTLNKDVTLGDNVSVGKGLHLERISVGNNTVLESRVVFTGFGSGRIVIGHDSYIGQDTALDFSDNVIIGDYVHIAGLSTGLWTHSSAKMCLNSISIADRSKENRPTARIVIEDNVYIGGNCTIYPGITIGHHSIVAPNSAVTKNVLPYSMVGGVPATFIKSTKDMITDCND